MYLNSKQIFPLLFFTSILYANITPTLTKTSDIKRDRIHSARKAIDSIAKAEVKEVSVVDSFKSMFEDAKSVDSCV